METPVASQTQTEPCDKTDEKHNDAVEKLSEKVRSSFLCFIAYGPFFFSIFAYGASLHSDSQHHMLTASIITSAILAVGYNLALYRDKHSKCIAIQCIASVVLASIYMLLAKVPDARAVQELASFKQVNFIIPIPHPDNETASSNLIFNVQYQID